MVTIIDKADIGDCCHKMANYGQISDFKMSMEASWQNALICHFRIFKTASLVAKNVTKIFLRFFLVQYMPHWNCSTAFVSQHIWKWLTVHGSMDPAQQLSHTKFSFWQLS